MSLPLDYSSHQPLSGLGGLGGLDGEIGYWAIGAMVPLVQCATHFALPGFFGGGLVWTVHLWAGVPAAAGLLGLSAVVLVVPPAFVRASSPGR